MTASTKELIERLRADNEGCGTRCDEAADALERLTQPVGVEPVGWRLQHTKHEIGVTSYNLEQMQGYVTDGWKITEVLYSAETVARLQAERDNWKAKAIHWCGMYKHERDLYDSLQLRYDALQEQVKMLLDHKAELTAYLLEIQACSASFHINGLVNKALAATEPKDSDHG